MARFIALICLVFFMVTLVDPSIGQSPLEEGKAAYLKKDYKKAYQLLKPLAEEGSPEAQHIIANLFEEGRGVPQNFVLAYVWHSRASQSEDGLAGNEKLKALERFLPEKELAIAQWWGAAEQLNLDPAKGCVSWIGDTINSHVAIAFRPNASFDEMVSDIVYYSGLVKNFVVMQVRDGNAAAINRGSKRLILYNPSFFQELNERTKTPWGAYSVMAHEIGHHLQGHTLEQGGSRPPIELQADEFSGFIMYKMGATLQEAQAAMASIGSPTGSSTHPARDQRLLAIKNGWTRGQATGPSSNTTGTPKPLPPPEPVPTSGPNPIPQPSSSPPAIPPVANAARFCVTMMDSCAMSQIGPAGYPCYCPTFWGPVQGISQ